MTRLFKGDAYVAIQMRDGSMLTLDRMNEELGRRLCIEFNCPKTRTPMPNKSMVKIHNLAKPTRDRIATDGEKAFLYAGYPDAGIKLFATGDIVFVDSRRESSEWITEVRFGDGMFAFNNSVTSISLGEGEDIGSVIDMLAADMGKAVSVVTDKISQITNGALTFDGLTKDAINVVAEDNGLEWSIQDDEIIIRDRFSPVDNEAIVINAASGLYAGVQKTQKGVKFLCQLNPDLRPGKLIKLEAIGYTIESGDVAKFVEQGSTYDGFYICKNVTALGNNYGGRFDCEVEAEEYDV
ncbi:hypothetical protein NVP1123O_28 [Vibrio phage 1.123.O._10N.286.48.F3]|nr:hypothetical protein NVP1123O_28 [Vibrio phage 1.123.O._10N.286.48.F3]